MRHHSQVERTIGVEPASAVLVGEWYLNARSAHSDPQVLEAYRQLQLETDRIFTLLTRNLCHSSVRVAFTCCDQPYGSDEELIHAVRAQGTLEVTSAAARQRLHPLFDCGFGGGFDRFRAVHDLIGHAWFGYGFGLDDECAAWRAQDHLHSGLARSALATELYGVNAARDIISEAPELRAILLPPPPDRYRRYCRGLARRWAEGRFQSGPGAREDHVGLTEGAGGARAAGCGRNGRKEKGGGKTSDPETAIL